MLKQVVLPLLILVLAVTLFFTLKFSKEDKPAFEQVERVWQVEVMPVSLQSISPEVTLYGRVETTRKAMLNAALNADVLNVNALEGDYVEKGQLIIQLDDTDALLILAHRQADLAEIEALITSESSRFKRDKTLLVNEKELLKLTDNAVVRARKLESSRLASKATLDDSLAARQRQLLSLQRLEHDVAEHPARLAGLKARQSRANALLSQAKVDLSRAQVKAPFSGRIAKRYISTGDRVRAGDNLLTLYDLDRLEVRAQIPARYIDQVRNNIAQGKQQSATTQINGKTITLVLSRLSGEVRLDSGGVDALFQVQDKGLTLGSFVELNLQLSVQDNVVAIPFNALYGLSRVYQVDKGYLRLINVQRVGEFKNKHGDNRILIRSDALKNGDLLLNTQLPNAITGLRVEASNN